MKSIIDADLLVDLLIEEIDYQTKFVNTDYFNSTDSWAFLRERGNLMIL